MTRRRKDFLIRILFALPKPVLALYLLVEHARVSRILVPRLLRNAGLRGYVKAQSVSTRHRVLGSIEIVRFTQPDEKAFLRNVPEYVRNRQAFRPPEVFTLRGAGLHVEKGIVVTHDRNVVHESVEPYAVRVIGTVPFEPASEILPGSHATIMRRNIGNYYHWLIDCLPRLHVLASAGVEASLIIPDRLADFQEKSLAACLPDGMSLTRTDATWVRPELLALPTLAARPALGYLQRTYLDFVRDRIVSRFGRRGEVEAMRRIYISRAGTNHRRVVNEDEVTESLTGMGFQIVRPETMDFEEQVKLFQEAAVVVGSRGAGLTNILFSREAYVLEITAANPRVGSICFSLAHALRHTYNFMLARPEGDDVRVEVRALESFVSRILIQRSRRSPQPVDIPLS